MILMKTLGSLNILLTKTQIIYINFNLQGYTFCCNECESYGGLSFLIYNYNNLDFRLQSDLLGSLESEGHLKHLILRGFHKKSPL